MCCVARLEGLVGWRDDVVEIRVEIGRSYGRRRYSAQVPSYVCVLSSHPDHVVAAGVAARWTAEDLP